MIFFGFDHQSHDLSPRMVDVYSYVEIDNSILSYKEQRYLPVISEYYLQEKETESDFVALVHIKNTSQFEPVYLLGINCYDANGDLCEKVIDESVKVNPLEANKFVVNTSLIGEGPGANVILDWGVKYLDVKPEIYIEIILNLATSKVSYIDEGKIISDQDEILDRRPL